MNGDTQGQVYKGLQSHFLLFLDKVMEEPATALALATTYSLVVFRLQHCNSREQRGSVKQIFLCDGTSQ